MDETQPLLDISDPPGVSLLGQQDAQALKVHIRIK